jgi:hypothetical protein
VTLRAAPLLLLLLLCAAPCARDDFPPIRADFLQTGMTGPPNSVGLE